MAAGVKDRLYVQVRINNTDIPLNDNVLDSLHLVESTRIGLPMLTFRIQDLTKFLTRNNLLVDAAPVEVTIDADGLRSVYYFRVFNFNEDLTSGGTSYKVQAYLDVPRYWSESSNRAFRGSVSGMLQEICRQTGLSYSGPATADTQLWLPGNTRYVEFAREVSERAWTGNSSCFQMAVRADKTMVLKDVSKLAAEKDMQGFSNKDNSDSLNVITDFAVINKAGFYNVAGGYKGARISQSLLSSDQTINSLTLKKNTKKMMMNQKVQDGISQSSVVFAPVDVGNVSDTYEKAIYQNRRLSNLFSFGLEFVTPRAVTANILDVVTCEIAKPGIDGVEQLSGKYLVVSKTTYIEGTNLYHKLEVFRHGLNTSKEDTLI